MFGHIHSAVPGRICAACRTVIKHDENIWFYLLIVGNSPSIEDDIVLCDP